MFYEKVLGLCKNKGISPSKLMTDLNMSKANIERWQNGSIPQNSTQKKLADYFGVPIKHLADNQSLPSNSFPVSDNFMNVPIIGRIPAGLPVVAIENIEGYETIPRKWLNGDPQNYFVLHVEGDSMKDAGIFDGDLVLIKRCTTCNNGQICAVGITGDTPDLYATLKRVFMTDNEHVELVPENSKYPRRMVKRSEVNIFGIVKKSIRNF